MAEKGAQEAAAQQVTSPVLPNKPSTENAAPKPSKPPRPPNPVFRMMGVPNFRFRLPSRNWMIFLSITGSFTAAIMYDRREKKLAQKKWCTLVSHMVQEPLPADRMRRKITVFLSPPPGDSLSVSRGYFREYVKPILAAAALDYEVVEGRREGDIRALLAEKVRKRRRKTGEQSSTEDTTDEAEIVALSREKQGIRDEDVIKGDLVIGRNTWKEYIRGLHEGWLGPMDPPPTPEPESPPELIVDAPPMPDEVSPLDDDNAPTSDSTASETAADSLPASSEPPKAPETETKKTTPRPSDTPPYISTTAYSTSATSSQTPSTFEPSLPLPFPHILGFLNTPTRIYRFFTQRRLADSIGRDVASLVLASETRPYAASESFTTSVDPDDNSPASPSSSPVQEPSGPGMDGSSSDILVSTGQTYEQSSLLSHEELEWPKRIREPKTPYPPGEEHVWLDRVVLDPRIADRMSRFEMDPEEEMRAKRIAEEKEGVRGEPWPPETTSTRESLLKKMGMGKAEDKRRKVIIGNLNGEDGE